MSWPGNIVLRVFPILLAIATCLLMASRASAFGTTGGQGAQHERITRWALECPHGSDPTDNSCFGPRSIDEMAGSVNYLGAVGKPDIYNALVSNQHCDDADYLADPSYPHPDGVSARARASAELYDCLAFLRGRFVAGTVRAGLMLDGNAIKFDQALIPQDGCQFNSNPSAAAAKCQGLEEFGGALHGTEDFYSHSNWVDTASPPYGIDNPPGLGIAEPSPLVDLSTGSFVAIPDALSTGCFSNWEPIIGGATNKSPTNSCYRRVTHYFLTKDEPTTPRSSAGLNYLRAISVAVADTKQQWERFQKKLDDQYGATMGHFIACAMTHDRLIDCFQLKYSATVSVQWDDRGDGFSQGPSHFSGSWTLDMGPARVRRTLDPGTFTATGPVTEQGGYSGSTSQGFALYCFPGTDYFLKTSYKQIKILAASPLTAQISFPQGPSDLGQLSLTTPDLPGQLALKELVRQHTTKDPTPFSCDMPPTVTQTTLVAGVLGTAHQALGLEDPSGPTAGLDVWKLGSWKPDPQGGISRDVNWTGTFAGGTDTVQEHFKLVPADPNATAPPTPATLRSAVVGAGVTPRPHRRTAGRRRSVLQALRALVVRRLARATPAGGARPAARRQLTAATVSGTVTDAGTHAAVANVHVTVYDSNGLSAGTTTTDVAGKYTVSGLAAGTDSVGFDPGAGSPYVPQFYNGEPSLASADPVTVSAGQDVSGIDAALARAARVTGTVTDARSHAALQGVQVSVQSTGKGGHRFTVTTDANGNYTAAGVPPGSYKVSFDASAIGNYVTQFYNNKPSLQTADIITLASGQTATAINAALQPGAQISGTVTDGKTHAAAQGVIVNIYDSSDNYVDSALTDTTGSYSVQRLAAGSYKIEFDATSLGNYALQYYNGKYSLTTATPVPLTVGQSVSGIDAALQQAGQISGTVTAAATHAPVANTQITIYDSAGNAYTSAATDATGKYTLTGLGPGSYKVGFDASSAGNYLPQFYKSKPSLASADLVPVAIGQSVTGIDAGLQAGGQIDGTVTNSVTHTAIQFVQVTVYDMSDNLLTSTSTDSAGRYALGALATGTYKVGFDASSAGDYVPSTQFYKQQAALAQATPIRVTAGHATIGIDAPMRPGGQLSGTVTDAVTHAAVPGGDVTLYDATGNVVNVTSTDNQGKYSIQSLAPGPYKVGFDTGPSGSYLPQYYNHKSSLATADATNVGIGQSVSGIDAALPAGGQVTGTLSSAATHTGLAGADVTVDDSLGNFVNSTTTAPNGAYTISGLATGRYTVRFDAGLAGDYQAQAYSGPVNVTAGHTTTGIGAALAPGGAVAGLVSNAATHAALGNVQVTLYSASGSPIRSAYTDAKGKYTIAGLGAGSYKVGFDPSAVGNYGVQFYNGKSSLAGADPIALAAGQTVSTINAASPAGGQLSGALSSATTHVAVPAAEVTVYDATGQIVAHARTDASGKYTISGLASASYRVGFDATAAGYLPQFYNRKSSLTTADPIPVTAGHMVSAIGAALVPGGQVSGLVVNHSTKAPLQDVLVTAYDSTDSPAATAITGATGKYTLSGLPTGSYKIGFNGSSADYVTQFNNGKPSLETADPVSVTAGQTVSAINVALVSGGLIGGTVTNASTHAVLAGTQVTAYDSTGNPTATTSTDAAGKYTLSPLPAGPYKLGFDAAAGGYVRQFYNGKPSLVTADPVSVTAGQTVSAINVALVRGGLIGGTVTNASTHAVVPGAQVTAYDLAGNPTASTSTDATGKYALSPLPAGTYKLGFDAVAAGYVRQFYSGKPSLATADPVSVGAGQTVGAVNAALAHGGNIAGSVTDATTHAGVQGADVSAYDSTGNYVAMAVTDVNGRYTVSGLPSGSYKVAFDATRSGNYLLQAYNRQPSLATANPIAVTAGQTATGISATLVRGGQIAGTISDASTHALLQGADVTAYDVSGHAVAWAPAGPHGSYTISGLSTGTYRVGVDAGTAGNYGPQFYDRKTSLAAATPISVSAAKLVGSVNVALLPGGQVSGTVTSAVTHIPLHGAAIAVYDATGAVVGAAVTDPTGRYAIPALAQGSYRIGFDGGTAGNYKPQFYNRKLTLASADPVAVSTGKTVIGIDAPMVPAASARAGARQAAGRGVGALPVPARAPPARQHSNSSSPRTGRSRRSGANRPAS